MNRILPDSAAPKACSGDFGFGVQKTEKGKALCKELNQYLADIKKSGEYDALRRKWEDPGRKDNVMGKYSFSGEKGTLRVATGGLWTPMSYYQGETLTGEFIEIVNGFCAASGYIPHFETVSLSAELAGLAAGTYDICADSITISEERLENIYITDPLMQDEYYMIVRRDPVEVKVPKAPLFFKNIQNSIRLVFEYSDTDGGNVDMKVTYPGQDQNPLEDGDTLSLALIRHACQKLDWQYRDGVCRIEGNLVHT